MLEILHSFNSCAIGFVDWKSKYSITFFRFIPIKSISRSFNDILKNGTQNGLIGFLMRNEAQAIMRSGFYLHRLDFVDYVMPIWKSR